VDEALNLARRQPDRYVVVYQDEATFYRQPSQGWLWAACGRHQPRMRYSHRSNTRMRVVGYLDGVTGAVRSQDMDSVTADRLARSVEQLSGWYPRAEQIYLVWDNWPVHSHPSVEKAVQAQSRVHLLPLPTYAPWLNPIEKLWRWTRQRVAHAHPWCDDFREFRRQVQAELDALTHGSPDLSEYIGL
jgi:hypothetical protein